MYKYDAHNNLADVASDIQLNATVTLINFDILLTSCVDSIIESFDLFRAFR